MSQIENYLRTLGRPALVADELDEDAASVISCQGGTPLAGSGEVWPSKDGVPLFPVLSVCTTELPSVPSFLHGAEYWTFFIEPDQFEQVTDDGSLVVRRHSQQGSLVQMSLPSGASRSRLALRFREALDYPCGLTLSHALRENPALLAEYQEGADEFDDLFPCHDGIKLGGYPQLIQGVAFLQSLSPDFQVQLDATELYSYADSGIGYIYGGLTALIWESM